LCVLAALPVLVPDWSDPEVLPVVPDPPLLVWADKLKLPIAKKATINVFFINTCFLILVQNADHFSILSGKAEFLQKVRKFCNMFEEKRNCVLDFVHAIAQFL
jgi:hypothetical protein